MNIVLDRFSTFWHVPFETLVNEWKVEIPPFQRELCVERVSHFLESIENYYYEFSEIINLNPINVALCDGKYWVLDGQHRFMAYKRLLNEFDLQEHARFSVSVIVRTCSTWDEVKSFFSVLNQHFMSEELITDAPRLDMTAELKTHIRNRFPAFISHTQRPRFPHINLDSFVSFLLEQYPHDTLQRLERANADTGAALHCLDAPRFYRIKAKGDLFFVHIYYAMKTQQKTRTALPASVRAALWTRSFPHAHEGKCRVCSKVISFLDFHAGHVVASANGGSDRLDNLECVCALCNLSMGTMNMDTFKAKYFP